MGGRLFFIVIPDLYPKSFIDHNFLNYTKIKHRRKCWISTRNTLYCFTNNHDMHTVVFEGLEPTDVWLRYGGTAGKPGGNGVNKP